MKRIALTVLALVPSVSVLAQIRPAATFDFDGGLNGSSAQGPIVGTALGRPEFAPGKTGQALKSGPTTGYVDYPTGGVLNRDSGTVEMWISPLDWRSDDGKFHVFFEERGKGVLYLYKFYSSSKLLMLSAPDQSGPFSSAQIDTDFQPGQWYHIAGTWSPQGVMVYLDGRPAATSPISGELPRELGATFRIGDQPWQFARTSSTLIDDVRIYDRALSPEEVAAHASGDYGFAKPLSARTSHLSYEVDPQAGTVQVHLDTGGADVEDRDLVVQAGIVSPQQQLPRDAARLTVQHGNASGVIALPARAPGNYEIVARVLRGANQSFDLTRALTIPRDDWLGNKIGLEDKVLLPWTPLQTVGTDVQCWGRRYSFTKSMLPTQIRTAGTDVLSRPIGLTLTSGSNTADWRDADVKVLSATSTRTAMDAVGVATLGGKTMRFSTHIRAAFDGLVVLEITCPDPQRLPIDTMSIDIPMKAEDALYRHRYTADRLPVSGSLPPGQGVVEHCPWVPFEWIGDNDRGLFWFTESDDMWPNSSSPNAVEIIRQAGQVVMRLNVLGKGQKLPSNWRFTLGIEATPVKPLPSDWRKWRMTSSLAGAKSVVGANLEVVWPHPNDKTSFSGFGYPEAADPRRFEDYIAGLHSKGLKAIPYLCLTFLRDDIPEWKYYRKLWQMGSEDQSIPNAGWKHGFAMVSPVGRGYADFIMAKTREFVQKYDVDGVYHDQTSPYFSNRLEAGLGHQRDGRVFSSTPILGYRALYRRNYELFKDLPRPTFLMAHMSGKVDIPVLAYEDAYLDGEQFRNLVKDDYSAVLPLDSFRAEYMGRQWGIMPFFLPQFQGSAVSQVEPTRGLMAMLMIHDTSVWPIWCNTAVVSEAYSALDAFGYVDSEFVPYFDRRPPASTSMKDVYVSAYRKPDGRVLLVIANLGRADRNGSILVDLARFGLSNPTFESWPDRRLIEAPSGHLRIDIPERGYRLVRISPK